jgi:hypothetical protein
VHWRIQNRTGPRRRGPHPQSLHGSGDAFHGGRADGIPLLDASRGFSVRNFDGSLKLAEGRFDDRAFTRTREITA